MDFYYFPSSPNCRSVMMAGKAVGVELNKKLLNTFAGDHLKPEFLRINPQHTVPTIVDHDFVLTESRAILIYLAEMYGQDDSLYPKIPKEKALVNHRLYFDISTLNHSFMEYYAPQFNSKPADPVAFQKVESAFALLDTFLTGQEYVAGDHLTVADIAILASVSTFDVMQFDIGKYKNVSKWYANAQKVTPGWDENLDGMNKMKEIVAPLLKANK